jgi:hypothetical protein
MTADHDECCNGLRLGWYQREKGVPWSSLDARVVKMPAPAGGPTRPACAEMASMTGSGFGTEMWNVTVPLCPSGALPAARIPTAGPL